MYIIYVLAVFIKLCVFCVGYLWCILSKILMVRPTVKTSRYANSAGQLIALDQHDHCDSNFCKLLNEYNFLVYVLSNPYFGKCRKCIVPPLYILYDVALCVSHMAQRSTWNRFFGRRSRADVVALVFAQCRCCFHGDACDRVCVDRLQFQLLTAEAAGNNRANAPVTWDDRLNTRVSHITSKYPWTSSQTNR